MGACDSETLGRLYLDERERLQRQIARRIGNAGVAQDLVHDVFLRVWERAGALHGNPAAFLNRAARNSAIDHLRREATRRTHAHRTVPDRPAADPAFDALSARQSAEAVRRAIDAMPDTTRRLFLMNRAQGLSLREIAAICGLSRRSVAKHVARAAACCARAVSAQDDEGTGAPRR